MSELIYNNYTATSQAQPTARVLEGSEDHGMAQEWSEEGKCGDIDVICYYIFSNSDITWDNGELMDAEDYPWDGEHVKKIVPVE